MKKKRTTSFTPEERKAIKSKLLKNLGPEYLSFKPGVGGKRLKYIEGWVAIELANRIFGFDGWNSKIRKMKQEYFEQNGALISVGYSCVCNVILKNGIVREDIGFGLAENMKSKAQAIENARKGAVTDALKRALRQFGSALGNCCYNKQCLQATNAIGQQGNMPQLKKQDTNCIDLFDEFNYSISICSDDVFSEIAKDDNPPV